MKPIELVDGQTPDVTIHNTKYAEPFETIYVDSDPARIDSSRPFDSRLLVHQTLVSELKFAAALIPYSEEHPTELEEETIDEFIADVDSLIVPLLSSSLEVLHLYLQEDGMSREKAHRLYSGFYFFFDMIKALKKHIEQSKSPDTKTADAQKLAQLVSVFRQSLLSVHNEIVKLGGYQPAGEYPRQIQLAIYYGFSELDKTQRPV